MDKLINDKNFSLQLLGFVILQPFVDIYRIFFENTIEIAGVSLAELINLLAIAYLVFLFVVKYIKQPKYFLPVLIYGLILGGYCLLHIWNISKFDVSILNGADISSFKELYYMLRVYILPLIVFYMFLCIRIKTELFEKVINILSGMISGIIVVTNLFKVSFISYASSLETNQFITRNIVEWFINPDLENPAYMTSKGWFYMGNQIGVILFMLYPFVIMQALKYRKKRNYFLVVIQGIAMIMVGTRVAAWGGLLILVAALVIAIIFGGVLKQFTFGKKDFLMITAVTICFVLLYVNSPVVDVQGAKGDAYEETNAQKARRKEMEKFKDDMDKGIFDEEVIKMYAEDIAEYPYSYGISEEFVKLFDVEDNFEFWFDVVISKGREQVNYRDFKVKIYEAVLERNDNKYDRWLGIGYTSGFPYVERDFAGQNIWFGYVGTILLLGPYYICALYAVFQILKCFKTHIRYENAFFAVSLGGISVLAYMAGHLFNGIFSAVIFAWLVSVFIHYQKNLEVFK